MVKELLATLTTNNQGEATYTYTGAGAGNIKFSAESTNNDNIISGIYNVFDCPVYDGDNIPISINFSKTNNAVVTDEVVSLIASVKNTNNNPCINIPVTFTQGNTILGHAYTDCTGDATITHVWEDSDIFDVTATVGENLSEDITMFVKDKDIEYITWDIGRLTNYSNIWSTSTTSSTIIVTRTGEYTEFKEARSSTNFANSVTGLTDSCTIEFDYWQLDGLTNTFMQIVKNGTQVTNGGMNLNMLNGSLESWCHLKLTIENGILTVLNETNGASFTKTLNDTPNNFNFWSASDMTTLRFKNFIISKR